MKAAVIHRAGEPFEIEDRPTPEPGPGQVRIRVRACGICHSDQFVAEALWPGLELPRVPGHEVAGVIDACGEGADKFQAGEKVGVGWFGGNCGDCPACRAGDIVLCENGTITGITRDGGYAEYMLAPIESIARIPEGISMAEAAPLLCAGVTMFNSLRHSGARPGDLVAIQGLGGLGHLGLLFADALGFRVAAISRGPAKRELAEKLGAGEFIDAAADEVGPALQKMGGARVIVATAPDARSISALIPALGRDGRLIVVAGAMEPFQVNAIDLISGRRSIQGWPSGHAQDSTDTLNFAVEKKIRPMIQAFPLQEVQTAYGKMLDGEIRFRAVLEFSAAR